MRVNSGLDAQGAIYCLKGNSTREFWLYTSGTDAWTQQEDMPVGGGKNIKGGGALVSATDAAALYAFKGNNTLEFYSYGPLAAYGSQLTANGPENALTNSELGTRNSELLVAPNPFTGATTISYSLSRPGSVSLRLYDISGKLVSILAAGDHAAGTSSFIVHRSSLSPGVYLLKLETENATATSKLVIQ